MAHVEIIKKTFNNEATGQIVEYERLAIIGSIGGVTQTLEIKLEKTELMLAKMLLNSTEKIEISVRTANKDEIDAFLDDIEKKPGKINVKAID